jgi:hypothetical protein
VVPVVGAVVVLTVAAIGYEQYIPIHHLQRARLSRLVVDRPPGGFAVKPTSSAEVSATSNPFATVKAAAKRSPNSTGSYSIDWAVTGSSTEGASALVSLLPSGSDAAAVQAEAIKAYLGASSFKSNNLSFEGSFSVPTPSDAGTAAFTSTSSKSEQKVAVVVFREDRVVFVEFVQETTVAKAEAAATSLAGAEYEHLRQLGSGFSLVVTSWPLEASLIYGAVAVAIVVAMLSVAPAVSMTRRRRRLAQEEAARREFRGRGRKIARHQAARRR